MIRKNLNDRSVAQRAAAMFVTVALLGGLSGCALLGGASNPLVGSWDITVESQLGTQTQTLVVADDLTGSVESADLGGALPISEVSVEGNAVSFKLTFDIGGQKLEAKFEGTIEGDKITGTYVTDLGNGEVTGTRNP